MNKMTKTLVIMGALILVIIMLRPFFIVQEGEQAVVIRFGKLIRTETEAGLKIKLPGIDNIVFYPKKILSWDGDARKVPTSEQQYVWVDTTARWRISNPEIFYEAVKTENQAQGKLDDVIESAVKTIISQYPLVESVRSSNAIIKNQALKELAEAKEAALSTNTQAAQNEVVFKKIIKGRQLLSKDIHDLAIPNTKNFGIDLIDIVVRQIRYSDELTQSVYDRMIQERAQKAQFNRSYGEGQKEEWLGKLAREKDAKLSDAYNKSETIKGEADAKAAALYAEAYGQDREFYNFWKAMESYKVTMPQLKKILTTDMNYFDYFYNKE